MLRNFTAVCVTAKSRVDCFFVPTLADVTSPPQSIHQVLVVGQCVICTANCFVVINQGGGCFSNVNFWQYSHKWRTLQAICVKSYLFWLLWLQRAELEHSVEYWNDATTMLRAMSTAVEIVALQTPSLEGTGLSTLYIRAVNEPSRSYRNHGNDLYYIVPFPCWKHFLAL